MSAALLSSPLLHSADGNTTDIFVDIATSIQSLLLSLLSCRSGLVCCHLYLQGLQLNLVGVLIFFPFYSGLTFLLLQPEATATLILSLQGAENRSTAECLTLRQAAMLMSKGFFCHPQEVAMITEIHLRVVS